ncbi:hypothetical protein OS965_03100 [Streptomyces sp. H27-G5]|uniref:hypothetical protein n=1 Tax=Streptomyces sp. H27-G5 TaxID=2996698 RepID=UPI002270674A|nr:hypothetical protein [Streptomyces sp. H27-G5]MCY0917164.1 hypothetical protein [Streptomyces sp. H27-G5]
MDTKKTPDPTAPATDPTEDKATATTPAEARTEHTGPDTVEPADKAAAEPLDGSTRPEASDDDLDAEFAAEDEESAQVGGVAAAASAIVAAGLSVVALSGSWVSRVVAERQNLVNQLDLSQTADNNAKIAALYSAPWHATALVNGILSAIALLLALFVLARPAFGVPGRTLPTWIRSVAWAAIALGALGVLLFALMYFDVLLPAPTSAA